MLRPSFVPPPAIRRLRDVARYRIDTGLTWWGSAPPRSSGSSRLLEDAQIKLSVVASDIFGASGRAMLAALIAGERDPQVLAQLARGRLRAKRSVLEEAFTGYFTDHHAFLLAKMLTRVDELDADIAELDHKLEELTIPFAPAVDRLDEITGVGRAAAQVILAEVGLDMTWTWVASPRLATWPRGPSSLQGSRSPPARRRAPAPPATATATWPGCWARRRWPPAGPTPSLGSATGASPDDAAPSEPSSRWVAPSW
jgi:transposase